MAFLAVIVLWLIVGIMAALSFGRLVSLGERPAPLPVRRPVADRPGQERRRAG